jgi:hypothetical protein
MRGSSFMTVGWRSNDEGAGWRKTRVFNPSKRVREESGAGEVEVEYEN